MRSPTKSKETLSKVLLLRWSFGSKDRVKHPVQAQPAELVEYLESGRRPRCTKDPIITLVATPPQRTSQGRTSEGHDCSLGCADRLDSDSYSPKIPEGQIRTRNDGSLRLRSIERAKQDQGRTLDFQLQRGAILGGHMSHSAPPSRDSSLRGSKVQTGRTSRTHKDPEDRNDSLRSFFKPGFIKKEAPQSPIKRQDLLMNGHGLLGTVARGRLTPLSLSNGTLTTGDPEERKACEIRHHKIPLVNGRTWAHLVDPADIKRAHSSSSIQTKLDLTFRRCSSLQRNGDVVVPASHGVLLSDTLQRTGYSTTSLGSSDLILSPV